MPELQLEPDRRLTMFTDGELELMRQGIRMLGALSTVNGNRDSVSFLAQNIDDKLRDEIEKRDVNR